MAASIKEKIGKNIRRYRLFKDWDQARLAEAVGLTRATISRIEAGRENTTLNNLEKIADALKVSMDDLCLQNPQTMNIRLVLSDQNVQAIREIARLFSSLK